MALIRFVVYDEDTFGEPNFVGQATYPVTCLHPGKDSTCHLAAGYFTYHS